MPSFELLTCRSQRQNFCMSRRVVVAFAAIFAFGNQLVV
jgi:hypothetical protein